MSYKSFTLVSYQWQCEHLIYVRVHCIMSIMKRDTNLLVKFCKALDRLFFKYHVKRVYVLLYVMLIIKLKIMAELPFMQVFANQTKGLVNYLYKGHC